MDLPSSLKNWDMPNFFPRMPIDIGGETTPAGQPDALSHWQMQNGEAETLRV
jgi:hypothetical protein